MRQVSQTLGFFNQEIAKAVKRAAIYRGTAWPTGQGSREIINVGFAKRGGQYLVGPGVPFPHQPLDAMHHGGRFACPGNGEDQGRAIVVIDNGLLLFGEGKCCCWERAVDRQNSCFMGCRVLLNFIVYEPALEGW